MGTLSTICKFFYKSKTLISGKVYFKIQAKYLHTHTHTHTHRVILVKEKTMRKNDWEYVRPERKREVFNSLSVYV